MLPKRLRIGKVISGSTAIPATSRPPLLELEKLHLRRLGQVAAARGLDEHHVFDAHGSPARIVEARLDRHHVASLEFIVESADARQLVNVETPPWPVPWKKPWLRPPTTPVA
jgi:hypothetical protein